MLVSSFNLRFTPLGHLLLVQDPDAQRLPEETSRRLTSAFERGSGHGLFSLGTYEVGTVLPPLFAWWRNFAARFVTELRTLPESANLASIAAPSSGELQSLAWTIPPMDGAEYLSVEVFQDLWNALAQAFQSEFAEENLPLAEFLKARNPAWNLVGRVHVHLAENRKDPAAPFAFLATYTSRLSAQAKAQHVPLGQALREYSGAADKDRLLSLLVPLQRASEKCSWLKNLLLSREIFHPLRWTAPEAIRFLQDIHHLEAAGVVIRLPATWQAKRPPRPQVKATIGSKIPSLVGADALLDFDIGVTLDGERLTRAEIKELLSSTQGLVLIRGRWVEVDRERLQKTLDHFEKIERIAADQGLGFHEAMRLLAGADESASEDVQRAEADWSQVVAGPWLAETLAGLRGPQSLTAVDPGEELHANLRPYQHVGVRWLHLLSRLRLGACLADDMGLGKTMQVISLLLVRRREEGRAASVLVAPASLLSNWAQEIERFAPSLTVLIAHPSATPQEELKNLDPSSFAGIDLVLTTYGSLHRLDWLTTTNWRLAILDEAQAIKNPSTRQTRSAKELKAQSKIAMTGTPVENRIGDLWSIFDFINPGLLGGAKAFHKLTKSMEGSPKGYAPLRTLVAPYILRRLKTDKTVISDLPDKTEMTAWCNLSKPQAILYQQAVKDLSEKIAGTDGIQRKGLILSFLMRFKQICNHASHWLGDGAWDESGSGKFHRLRELAEVIAAKQEKVLVFSQFRETSEPLAHFLGTVFAQSGLILTGETPVKQRKDLVQRFQEDDRVPFFILSLKAGGSGLNLTAASHVIHFDRWWNPAVENQATDRAFRIGQTRNVLVHKFVCRGTIEEKIDLMITEKRALANDLLGSGSEIDLTKLSDSELLNLVKLDLRSANTEE